MQKAERIISTPYRTVSLLAGAIAAGDEGVLRTVVADARLLQQKLGGDSGAALWGRRRPNSGWSGPPGR